MLSLFRPHTAGARSRLLSMQLLDLGMQSIARKGLHAGVSCVHGALRALNRLHAVAVPAVRRLAPVCCMTDGRWLSLES